MASSLKLSAYFTCLPHNGGYGSLHCAVWVGKGKNEIDNVRWKFLLTFFNASLLISALYSGDIISQLLNSLAFSCMNGCSN